MKSFRKQYSECRDNKTAELLEVKKPEKVYLRPNQEGIESILIGRVYFCNKYMKRCSSKVCFNERI